MKRINAKWISPKNNEKYEPEILNSWIIHHQQSGFNVSVYVEPNDNNLFHQYYPQGHPVVKFQKSTEIENNLEINTTDFLFEWFIDDQDQFVLTKPMVTNWTETGVIGRVFHVPVENQDRMTTFEIPDFIQYKHRKHSAFTINGIKTGIDSKEPSNRWVCFSLIPSSKQCSLQYYQNTLLLTPEKKHQIGKRIYEFYHMNVVVQKEHSYGIIWHPKCGCSTIMKIFCSVNNISVNKNQPIRSLNFFFEKFRYNVYLEEIEYLHFVRNPYYRFLSTYIDKQILQRDEIFLELEGYKEFKKRYNRGSLMDLYLFLKEGKYISEHYVPQSKIILSPNIPTFQIDDNNGLNQYLTNFLKNFHPKMNLLSSLGCFENSIKNYSLQKKTEEGVLSKLKYYSREEWLEYLEKNNLNYDNILDEQMKQAIYVLFKDDFQNFNYETNITYYPVKINYNNIERNSIGMVDDFNPDWTQN